MGSLPVPAVSGGRAQRRSGSGHDVPALRSSRPGKCQSCAQRGAGRLRGRCQHSTGPAEASRVLSVGLQDSESRPSTKWLLSYISSRSHAAGHPLAFRRESSSSAEGPTAGLAFLQHLLCLCRGRLSRPPRPGQPSAALGSPGPRAGEDNQIRLAKGAAGQLQGLRRLRGLRRPSPGWPGGSSQPGWLRVGRTEDLEQPPSKQRMLMVPREWENTPFCLVLRSPSCTHTRTHCVPGWMR